MTKTFSAAAARFLPSRKWLTLVLLLPALAMAAEINLSGESRVRYLPDSARLQFTITAEHPDASQASAQVRETMARWRDGIADVRDQLVDYSDAAVNLYQRQLPVRSANEKRETIAVASQTISFEVHNLELINPLLDQAQALGIQYHLGPQQFFHSREAELQKQALAGAIADARSRCEFAAGELGMKCGKVKTLNIQDGYRPGPVMMAEARMGAADTVSEVGPRELTASVSATFELR